MSKRLFEELKQPEYTGENRCEACTVVNIVLALVAAVIIDRYSRVLSVLFLLVSGGLIYLRGYLVPGTPTLTKRYLPPTVLEWFGKDPNPVSTQHGLWGGAVSQQDDIDSRSSEISSTADIDSESDSSQMQLTAEEYFLKKDILEPCKEIDDLCLTDEFERRWEAEVESIAVDEVSGEDIAETFGIENLESSSKQQFDSEYEVREFGQGLTLEWKEEVLGKWPSEAALVADVAAASVLDEIDDRWSSNSPKTKGEFLNGLRVFFETCPTTGEDAVMDTETVESCCSEHEVVSIICEESGERLFEQPID